MTMTSTPSQAVKHDPENDHSIAIFTAIQNEDEPAPKPPFKGSLRPFKRKEYKPNQPGQDHGNRLVEPPASIPAAPGTHQS
jgi:hypothetical protein